MKSGDLRSKIRVWPWLYGSLKGDTVMSEKLDELKKLVAVATDMALAPRLRVQAIELIAQIGTHEALLALLDPG